MTSTGSAGKYGATAVETDLLALALEDRKELKDRHERSQAEQGAPVRRKTGNMSNLSGGSSHVYAEVQRPTGPRHKAFTKRK